MDIRNCSLVIFWVEQQTYTTKLISEFFDHIVSFGKETYQSVSNIIVNVVGDSRLTDK